MSILNAIRAGVKVADGITKPLQGIVQFQHCTGTNKYGPVFEPAVPLRAIIDFKTSQVRGRDGVLSKTRCQVTFLDVAAVKAATQPLGRIQDIDMLTLPDGTGGTIISVGGFVDAETGLPVATDVWI